MIPDDARNIVLTGFMGTGKTTVGLLVADGLRRKFIDTDEEIIERFGMTILQIFETHGEEGFRRFELIIAQSIAARQRQVVSTGGGMLINPANRAQFEATGIIICLQARPDAIEARLAGGEGRPLAAGWRELLARRQDVYDTMTHHIDTSDITPEQAAEEVTALWRRLT